MSIASRNASPAVVRTMPWCSAAEQEACAHGRHHEKMPVDVQDAPPIRLQRIIGASPSSSSCLAYHPTATRWLATAAGCVVVLRDLEGNAESRIFSSNGRDSKPIKSLAFAPDGRYLAAGEDGRNTAVLLFDLDLQRQKDVTGVERAIKEMRKHRYTVAALNFSRDGAWLVSCGEAFEGAFFVWSVATGQLLLRQACQSELRWATFAAEGKSVLTVGRGYCAVWAANSNPADRSRRGEGAPAKLLQKVIATNCRDDTLIAAVASKPTPGSAAGTTFLVLTATGRLLEICSAKRTVQRAVDVQVQEALCLASSSPMVAVGGSAGVVRLYSSRTLAHKGNLPKPVIKALQKTTLTLTGTGHSYPSAQGLAFCHEGQRLAVAYSDRSVHVWNVSDTCRIVRVTSLLNHNAAISGLVMLPASKNTLAATASVDGTVRLWDVQLCDGATASSSAATNGLVSIMCPVPEAVPKARPALLKSGLLSKDNTLQRHVTAGLRVAFTAVASMPSGRHLATGDVLGMLRVYDISTFGEVYCSQLHSGDLVALQYSQQQDKLGHQLLVTAGLDGRVQVLGVSGNTYIPLQRISVSNIGVNALHISSDGSHLVVCSRDKTVSFWKNTGNPKYFIINNQATPNNAAQTVCLGLPNGETAITGGGDNRLRVWDLKNGVASRTAIIRSTLPGEPVSMACDASGRLLAVADSTNMLTLWDVTSGAMLCQAQGHGVRTSGLAISLADGLLVSVGAEGCLYVWALPAMPGVTFKRTVLPSATSTTALAAVPAAKPRSAAVKDMDGPAGVPRLPLGALAAAGEAREATQVASGRGMQLDSARLAEGSHSGVRTRPSTAEPLNVIPVQAVQNSRKRLLPAAAEGALLGLRRPKSSAGERFSKPLLRSVSQPAASLTRAEQAADSSRTGSLTERASADGDAREALQARLPDWAKPKMGIAPINVRAREGMGREGRGSRSARTGPTAQGPHNSSARLGTQITGHGANSARMAGEWKKHMPSTSRWLSRINDDDLDVLRATSATAAAAEAAKAAGFGPAIPETQLEEPETVCSTQMAPSCTTATEAETLTVFTANSLTQAGTETGFVQRVQPLRQPNDFAAATVADCKTAAAAMVTGESSDRMCRKGSGANPQQQQRRAGAGAAAGLPDDMDDTVCMGSIERAPSHRAVDAREELPSLRLTTPGGDVLYTQHVSSSSGMPGSAADSDAVALQPRDLFKEAFLAAQPSTSNVEHHETEAPVAATPVASPPQDKTRRRVELTALQRSFEQLGGEWESMRARLATSPSSARHSSRVTSPCQDTSIAPQRDHMAGKQCTARLPSANGSAEPGASTMSSGLAGKQCLEGEAGNKRLRLEQQSATEVSAAASVSRDMMAEQQAGQAQCKVTAEHEEVSTSGTQDSTVGRLQGAGASPTTSLPSLGPVVKAEPARRGASSSGAPTPLQVPCSSQSLTFNSNAPATGDKPTPTLFVRPGKAQHAPAGAVAVPVAEHHQTASSPVAAAAPSSDDAPFFSPVEDQMLGGHTFRAALNPAFECTPRRSLGASLDAAQACVTARSEPENSSTAANVAPATVEQAQAQPASPSKQDSFNRALLDMAKSPQNSARGVREGGKPHRAGTSWKNFSPGLLDKARATLRRHKSLKDSTDSTAVGSAAGAANNTINNGNMINSVPMDGSAAAVPVMRTTSASNSSSIAITSRTPLVSPRQPTCTDYNNAVKLLHYAIREVRTLCEQGAEGSVQGVQPPMKQGSQEVDPTLLLQIQQAQDMLAEITRKNASIQHN